MASEDVAYVSQEISTVLYNIGASAARIPKPYPVHHPQLMLDESLFPDSIPTFLATAFEFFASQA